MSLVIPLTLAMLTVALCLALVRLIRGPTLPDRVVALELFSTLIVGIVGVISLQSESAAILDVAIVMALMTFLATIGFARFLEGGGPRDD